MTPPFHRFHVISFKHAFDGLVRTFYTQPNLRVHLTVGILVIMLAALLKVTRLEWLILLFTIMWVLISEMINTVVEAICDLVSEEYHTQIKVAKDVAAGMVLIGAIGSVIVGLVVFIPYLSAIFR